MTDTSPEPAAERSAYDLLTAPVETLTDADVELICADLRRRRLAYVQQGKKDEPHKAPKTKPTAAEKAKNTADLLANLGLADL